MNVAYWHLADVRKRSINVRFSSKSGHRADLFVAQTGAVEANSTRPSAFRLDLRQGDLLACTQFPLYRGKAKVRATVGSKQFRQNIADKLELEGSGGALSVGAAVNA